MNVLSLFDGMSCGQIALHELGIKVGRYYASEINKHAIKQTQLNFPDTIQLGDVRGVHAKDLPKIDLLIGGSPCQGFSFAGKQLNFHDPRSALFFEFVRILNECREVNPDVKFLLENVRMKRECEQVISDTLGIKPVMINSALVSAQNRVRLYWSNVLSEIPQPQDRCLCGYDVIGKECKAKQKAIIVLNKQDGKLPFRPYRLYDPCGLFPAICSTHQGYDIRINDNGVIRKLAPSEAARLQTIPDWYRWECSVTQQYTMLGNGWTVEVIKHIFSFLQL